jgi:uncharacterized protein with HEPN domain
VKNDLFYVIHMLENIARIGEYSSSGREAFFGSTLLQDGITRNLQLLGESAKQVSGEVKDRYPEVDWRGIIALRNVLVHEYIGLSHIRIWDIVERDINPLKNELIKIRKDLGR